MLLFLSFAGGRSGVPIVMSKWKLGRFTFISELAFGAWLLVLIAGGSLGTFRFEVMVASKMLSDDC